MKRAAIPFARATVGQDGLLTIPVGLVPGTRLAVTVTADGDLVFQLLTPPSKEDTSL